MIRATFDDLSISDMIFHNKTSLCIKPDGLDKAAKYVVSLLDNRELKSRLGKNTREYIINNFQMWEERIDKEIDTVYELVKSKKSKAWSMNND